MQRKHTSTLLLLIAYFMVMPSCNFDRDSSNWQGGVINKYGTYKLTDKLRLEVSNNDGLLNYSIFNVENVRLFKNRENISTYSNWFLFWDVKSEQLWICSSDIGVFVWVRDDVISPFRKITLEGKQCKYCDQLPKIFYENLPSVFKKYFKPI